MMRGCQLRAFWPCCEPHQIKGFGTIQFIGDRTQKVESVAVGAKNGRSGYQRSGLGVVAINERDILRRGILIGKMLFDSVTKPAVEICRLTNCRQREALGRSSRCAVLPSLSASVGV